MLRVSSDGTPYVHANPKSVKHIKPKGQTCESLGLHMAKDWQIKKRRPVRRKNIAPLLIDCEEALVIDFSVDGAFLEMSYFGPL